MVVVGLLSSQKSPYRRKSTLASWMQTDHQPVVVVAVVGRTLRIQMVGGDASQMMERVRSQKVKKNERDSTRNCNLLITE